MRLTNLRRVCDLLLVTCAFAYGGPAQKPPTSTELSKLVRAFFAEDDKTPAGYRRQLEILERVRAVEPLAESQVKSWRKRLLEAWGMGRRLQKKGDNWFWTRKKKGRYTVGGRTSRPKALVIAIVGGDPDEEYARIAHDAYSAAASKLGWVLISPEVLPKSGATWVDSGADEPLVYLIAAARRTFKIDADRVYVTGNTLGGFGSCMPGARHPARFAALAPFAGAPTPILDRGTERVIDIVEGVIPSLRNLPVVCYQSQNDNRETNRVAIQKLKDAQKRWGGFDHEYREFDSRGQVAPPGEIKALLAKAGKRKRDARPRKLVWQPVLSWKRQFYWLHWEKPIAKTVVAAEFDPDANTVRIECESEIAGLSVLLDPGMFDPERPVRVHAGDRSFSIQPKPTLETLLMTSRTGDPGRTFAYRIRVPPKNARSGR